MALSIYISLKFTGVTAEMKWKRQIYIAISLGIVLVSMVLAIPATVQAGVFQARKIRRREKLASGHKLIKAKCYILNMHKIQ